MREIGRLYAALAAGSDDLYIPGHTDEVLFESEPVPADAWEWFVFSNLCDRVITIKHVGFIDYHEEGWFEAPQLPELVVLIETERASAPPGAQAWLDSVVRFARRAHARGVGIAFIIGG